MNRPSFALFASLALSLPACSIGIADETTVGEEGHARFAYTTDCFLDCPVTRPMLVGTIETIAVRPTTGSFPKLTIKSSNPGVLSVSPRHAWSCCKSSGSSASCSMASESTVCEDGFTKQYDFSFEVVAHAEGSAEIAIADPLGRPIDRVVLEAALPARFDLQRTSDARSVTAIDLTKDATIQLRIDSYDAKGRKLQAAEGIRLTVADPKVATFDDPSWFSKDPGGYATLEDSPATPLVLRGRATGATTLTVASPGFSSELPVTVH